MTIEDELRTLINRLPRKAAQDAVEFRPARVASGSGPAHATVQGSQTAP